MDGIWTCILYTKRLSAYRIHFFMLCVLILKAWNLLCETEESDESIISCLNVENLKALLEVETQVSIQQQQLLYNGKEMRNAEKLSGLVCVWCCVAVITGGLDSKLVMWDFSKGRPQKLVDFDTSVPDADNAGSAGQCLNPAFVHAIAVPEVDMVDRLGKVCVVARGDGVVDVIDIESELAVIKSKSSLKPWKGTQSKAKGMPHLQILKPKIRMGERN
ncbi:hypothetical protein HYC85_011242 [Camellia sinensis]|uniref:Ubiquitin-like domain-containing protein n=1 Tax=Camellia sinensis TaxID=4442 RepID=A0A7J7H8S7_CAMSI|nr:hypothetical protein HYC85_011242 [Camellia sinensis]